MNEENSKKIVDIGLDIGIASVGWAITDVKTLGIEEYGARLFPTVDDAKDSKLKNEARRSARSARRQVNRRKTLKRDFIKFLIKENLVKDLSLDDKNLLDNFSSKYIKLNKKDITKETLPYLLNLRKEALSRKLSDKELISVLYWYINHRGFKYEVAGSEDQKKNKELIEKYYNESKLPMEIQEKYFLDNGYINGNLNRIFHSKDYTKEIELISKEQKLSNEFLEKFINLFQRQRSFEEGPGNENTPTRYGRFYEVKEEKGQVILQKREKPFTNIWEATIGKCTFYPNENRAPKKSLTSELFNLLNDLNNFHVGSTGEILNEKQKLAIINKALQVKDSTKGIVKYLLAEFGLEKEDVDELKGFIKDGKNNIKITNLTTYGTLSKMLPEKYKGIDYLIENNQLKKDNIYDKIVDIFSQNKAIEKRLDALTLVFKDILSEEEIKKLSEIKFTGSETHSLSYKAMQNMIPDLIAIPKMNQMVWAKENGIEFNSEKDFGSYYLKSDWIEELIITPTVKRAFRQTTKVLNAIFQLAKDRNYEIRSIIIEMARETKNKEARDNETNRNKYLEQKRDEIKGFIEEIKGVNFSVSNRTIEKIWLLQQQDSKDAYDGKDIKAEDVINNPGKFDIDHIIPYSQSYSNNRSNKVLTTQQNNHKKGKRTPKQYLSEIEFSKMVPIWESWYKNSKDKRFKDANKLSFITTELDYSDPENQLGFIQRNLVDTRYATKMIFGALKSFVKSAKNPFKFNVKAINGKMTSFARNKISIKRDKDGHVISKLSRPEGLTLFEEVKNYAKNATNLAIKPTMKKSRIWHGHHAEDAYIVTVLNSHYNDSKFIEKLINSPEKYNRFRKNKWKETQDKIINNNFQDLLDKFDIARDKLNAKMKDIRFSRMVEKKVNTKLFNETLYKGKINGNFVEKYSYKKLLDSDFKASEFFGDNPKNKEKLLMYKYNRNLYEALNEIYENYKDGNKNPFIIANEETKGNGKHIIVSYKNKKGNDVLSKVSRINYLVQENKNPLRIVQAKNNGNSFYESMEWIRIDIYKNIKDKYKIILVDASNHIFETKNSGEVKVVPNLDILNKQKESKGIDLNSKPVCSLYKGDLIESPEGEILYVTGHFESADKLEVKQLSRNKKDEEKSQDHRTLNKKLLSSRLFKQNILGMNKKYNFTF